MSAEHRLGFAVPTTETEAREADMPRRLFERRQHSRREADRLLDEHSHTEDEGTKRDLARAAFEAMHAVPPEEDRRTHPEDRRHDDVFVPAPGMPANIL